MLIGRRLREVRVQKGLSQGDVEKRTGLLRCYLSRVENGHTIPSVETLEKMAHALEVPMYQLFYEGDQPVNVPLIGHPNTREGQWGSKGKDARLFGRLRRLLGKMNETDRGLLLAFATKAAQQKRGETAKP
jgi:transcriptional regulator with XRE-family HTH domain